MSDLAQLEKERAELWEMLDRMGAPETGDDGTEMSIPGRLVEVFKIILIDHREALRPRSEPSDAVDDALDSLAVWLDVWREQRNDYIRAQVTDAVVELMTAILSTPRDAIHE